VIYNDIVRYKLPACASLYILVGYSVIARDIYASDCEDFEIFEIFSRKNFFCFREIFGPVMGNISRKIEKESKKENDNDNDSKLQSDMA